MIVIVSLIFLAFIAFYIFLVKNKQNQIQTKLAFALIVGAFLIVSISYTLQDNFIFYALVAFVLVVVAILNIQKINLVKYIIYLLTKPKFPKIVSIEIWRDILLNNKVKFATTQHQFKGKLEEFREIDNLAQERFEKCAKILHQGTKITQEVETHNKIFLDLAKIPQDNEFFQNINLSEVITNFKETTIEMIFELDEYLEILQIEKENMQFEAIHMQSNAFKQFFAYSDFVFEKSIIVARKNLNTVQTILKSFDKSFNKKQHQALNKKEQEAIKQYLDSLPENLKAIKENNKAIKEFK